VRYEKISLADLAALPADVTSGSQASTDEYHDAEIKAPPVAYKHFHYCGRNPSRGGKAQS
jgi:hypothetical protein